MSATFTPGPWKVERATNRMLSDAGDKETHPLVVGWRCSAARYERGAEEQEANARLIAAAPELLEALRAYASWFDHHPAFFDAITGKMREAAHAVITKAEGSAD